jgi:hypothetical protein
VDPVISSGEHDRLLRPTQGLHGLGMDEVDLALVLAIRPLAHMRLEASDDHVDQSVSRLEGPIRVVCL